MPSVMPSAIASLSTAYSRPSESQAAADAIPILVDDEYQIFHLSTPPDTVRHPPRLRSTWSRMRSRNLVQWTRDDVEALYPGKSPESPDADGAWTGSAVIGPDGNMHLFYTGYNLSQEGKQVILHARSDDKHGTAFKKSPNAISISGDMSKFEDIDFRDAHVSWMEPEGRYWMLVATRLRFGPFWTRGCLALLTSSDLEDWKIEPEPFYAPNDMFCPECPELFSMPNGKWYLVYSRFHAPDAGTVYRMADSPRGPFRNPRGGSGSRLDGRRWYAAKSCPKARDPTKRIFFGWIADKLEGQWSWGGDMGIPREVSADTNGHLIVEPNRAFLDATLAEIATESRIPLAITLDSLSTTKVESVLTHRSDYCLSFRIVSHDAASFGLVFRTDKDMASYRLRLVPTSSGFFDMSLISCPPPLDDFWADQYRLHIPREVDGTEVARHAAVPISGPVIVIMTSDVLQIFAGGKSISFRLPRQNGANEASGHGSANSDSLPVQLSTRELGFYTEDGTVSFEDVTLHEGTFTV